MSSKSASIKIKKDINSQICAQVTQNKGINIFFPRTLAMRSGCDSVWFADCLWCGIGPSIIKYGSLNCGRLSQSKCSTRNMAKLAYDVWSFHYMDGWMNVLQKFISTRSFLLCLMKVFVKNKIKKKNLSTNMNKRFR